MKTSILVVMFLSILSCKEDDTNTTIDNTDSILSASVAFSYNGAALQNFFEAPTKAYVSGYFYFDENLASDVIFGLDIEWFEGVENPVNFEGADWMAYVGLTRSGNIWIPVGLPENLSGTPNTDNWQILNLNQELQPNSWYKMTITANYNTLKFVSLKVEGNGIDSTLNIDNLRLQYPNYASFDLPTLTFYTFASRSRDLITTHNSSHHAQVYFDDIQAGIEVNGTYEVIFQNGFENQLQILTIPVNNPVIPLASLEESQWYFENEQAKLTIVSNVKHSGNNALLCNAD